MSMRSLAVPPQAPIPTGEAYTSGAAAGRPGADRRWLWGGLFLGWWTLFALIYGNMYFVRSAEGENPLSWGRALGIGFLDMYLWAALCLVAFALAWYLPLTRERWRRSVALHLVAAALVLVGRLLVENLFASWTGVLDVAPLSTKLLIQTPSHAMAYFTLVGVGYALAYYRKYREHELSASQLETQLTRAQLQVLKTQLHPHFLFNTLNAISALMHRDVRAADRMLARLEDLLRRTIEKAGTQEVALKDELELLEPYLEIEQTRFGNRLSVEWLIDPDTLDARVPHLLLQPLVENAIRHGIAPRSAPGRIEISAQRNNGRLQLQVRDNGRGLSNGARKGKPNTGVGLANTRARLAQLYNGGHFFQVSAAAEGGVVVTMEIPFRLTIEERAGKRHGGVR